MILPKKHLMIEESLFGFGAFLLAQISENISVDDLWKKYRELHKNGIYAVSFSFDKFILTIDYLYVIGAISINEKGEIYNATY